MATAPQHKAPQGSLHPDTAIGAVSLSVSDLSASRDFYERAIGLTARERDDGAVALGAPGGPPLVVLHGDSAASPLDRRATGLFHLAILLPGRADLAAALVRLAEVGWPLDGASDHLVSEALYLSDPDGNGIEIYRDRPRAEWTYRGETLQMSTLPLDLEDVLGSLGGETRIPAQVPASTRIGHVHLQVAELERTESFYTEVIGFDVTVRGYPGALFVSAGGYHHHLGLNTWNSAGAAPARPDAVGLRHWELALADGGERRRIVERATAAGVPVAELHGAPLLHDPSGNGVLLTAPGSG
jgi:catechol 2,3-dioxygenase